MTLSEQELNALIETFKETILTYERALKSAKDVIVVQADNLKLLQNISQKQEILIEQLKHQIEINNLLK